MSSFKTSTDIDSGSVTVFLALHQELHTPIPQLVAFWVFLGTRLTSAVCNSSAVSGFPKRVSDSQGGGAELWRVGLG